ncbi:DUF1826 domain-containing protein [Aliidiomarina minuta]|uniref:DUF1826 domain-containing protein n=1 Tax=Aliidiomarina minuta TaxID=880057 RepID=A0A432WA99_9GAMM|nr:DUF1826 domain-containing protein [Aliidiomarina minuta]RUO26906.1 DUF1826 domain-containing protein [Aliidiomarina minuta]
MHNSELQDQELLTRVSRNAVFSQDVDVLTHIFNEDINLAGWQRQLSSQIQQYLVYLIGSGFNQLRCITRLNDLVDVLQQELPEHAAKAAFVEDVYQVADMYACLMEAEELGVRLTKLTAAMCPRFHTDKLPCRLITTYAGCGSEWLPDNAVNRDYLGPQGHGKETRLYADQQDKIQQLASGEVALFKGDGWQGHENRGIVHRSPALAPGQSRIILTLDGR